MIYENAYDVLPETLLREIQKYAAGKLLYITVSAVNRIAFSEAITHSTLGQLPK